MTFPDFLQNMLQILQNAQGSDSAATARGKRGSKKSSIRATRNLRRSARFAEEAEPAAAKRTSFASSCSGGGSSGGGGVTDEEKKQLLRFRGFEANDAGKECICCYQVANITVNFMCEVSEGSTEHETSLYKFAEVMLSLLLLLEHTHQSCTRSTSLLSGRVGFRRWDFRVGRPIKRRQARCLRRSI